MIKKFFKWIVRILILFICFVIILIIIIGGGFGDKSSNSLPIFEDVNIFAHRGLLKYYAENSMEGFINSEKFGFVALETDIRITNDKRLVLFHDESCMQMLGIDKNLNELSLNEIQKHPILFNGKATKNYVITLNDFIEKFKNRFVLYIDFKNNSKLVADSMLFCIKKHNAYNSILIANPNILFLAYIKYHDDKINTVLEGFNSGKEWLYYIIPKKFKPDFYSSYLSKVDEEHIEFMKSKRLLNNMIVYGVDNKNITDVYKFGIKNIIFDYDSSLNINEIRKNIK